MSPRRLKDRGKREGGKRSRVRPRQDHYYLIGTSGPSLLLECRWTDTFVFVNKSKFNAAWKISSHQKFYLSSYRVKRLRSTREFGIALSLL